jgi:hypothetical protein
MRKLVVFLFCLVSGAVLGAAGVCLAMWVALALYKVELAFDWALWAAEHAPFSLSATPMQLANAAIQRDVLFPAGLAAAIVCWLAIGSLRAARRSLRSADESDDGKARIELKAEHSQVGRALEGSLRLARDAKPGDVFRVELSCTRRYRDAVGSLKPREHKETAFFEARDVQAAQDAQGWKLPFKFDVPATAPPTAAGNTLAEGGYRWLLVFYPANAWIAVPSEFVLQMAAAAAEEQ